MNVISIVLLLSCITFVKSQYDKPNWVTSKDNCTWSKCGNGHNGDELCGKRGGFIATIERCYKYSNIVSVYCCVLAISKPGCKWTGKCFRESNDNYSNGCETTFSRDYEVVRKVRCPGIGQGFVHECCPKKKA